jgi:hypothetical protein
VLRYDPPVTMREASPAPGPAADERLGFFVFRRDEATYQAGLMVASLDGDPLDFVYTEPVTLSRVSLRLLGPRADGYVVERVLLPPLLEQAGSGLRILCLDDPAILQRKVRLGLPCAVLAPPSSAARRGAWVQEGVGPGAEGTWWVPQDAREAAVEALRGALAGLSPDEVAAAFAQLRAAMAEVKDP